MKTKNVLLVVLLLCGLSVKSQNYPRLNVLFKKDFNTKLTIFVEPIVADNAFVVELLKNSLKSDGFIVTDDSKVADYVIKIDYRSRTDMGCNGIVIKKMDGRVVGSNGETIIIFNFGQNSFEGKCTDNVMRALSHKFKTEYFKN